MPYNSIQLSSDTTCAGCYLYIWPTGHKSEIPTTFYLGSINLLKQLTELRETYYLLRYWFIITEYNLGTARWKRRTGQGIWEGVWSSHVLFMEICSWQTRKLSKAHPLVFFVEVSLYTRDWLNHQPLAADSTSSSFLIPGGQGWDWTFQPPNHTILSPGSRPILGYNTKVTPLM